MSLPGRYFDALYADAPDPWEFGRRWYEQRKRALTLALLPSPTYARVFEPGCSIGVLTEALAPRCEQLLATDVAATAVAAARERVAHLPHVRVEQAALPDAWPDDDLDLVVLSELGYYFDDDDLAAVAQRATAVPTVLAVHWRHPVVDYVRPGDAVHAALAATAGDSGLTTLAHYEDADLVADVWTRDGRSVAAREGLT